MARRNGMSRTAIAAAGLGALLVGRELLARRPGADLSGEVALITGGSRGLGFLLAREFARQGCRVAICARDEAELARAHADLTGYGATVLAVRCDISDRADVERLVEDVTRNYGRIDILVNNAGRIDVGPLTTMTVEDFERSLAVMFWGTVYPTLAVLPQMRERRHGRIVNITSIGGKVAVPKLVPYCAAKFAAVGFSAGLRTELGRYGIQVTTVVPGLMRTGSYLNAYFKEPSFLAAAFAVLGNLPGTSMDAERAARRIVEATRRGEVELTLTLPAELLARLYGLFPGTVTSLLSLIDRVLPEGRQRPTAGVRGMEIPALQESPVLRRLTALGQSAATRFHQRPGPVHAGDSAGARSA